MSRNLSSLPGFVRYPLIAAVVCALPLSVTAPVAAESTLETIAYEGFDYPGLSNGSVLASGSGGTGWSSAWTAGCSMVYNTSGLTYAGLTTTGGRAEYGSGCSINNDLTRIFPRYDNGVVFIQFLSQLNVRGGGTPNIRLADGGSQTGAIGNNDGGVNMAIMLADLAKVDPGNPRDSGVSISNLNLTVMRIDHVNNQTDMWVNPDLATFDYLNPPAAQATATSFAPVFDRITLIVRDDTTDFFDEITIKRVSSQAPTDPTQRPPDWMKQVGRVEGASCEPDWHPSWAQWPNGGTGGFTCVQVLTWSDARQGFVMRQ
jgi:hypothetical protein